VKSANGTRCWLTRRLEQDDIPDKTYLRDLFGKGGGRTFATATAMDKRLLKDHESLYAGADGTQGRSLISSWNFDGRILLCQYEKDDQHKHITTFSCSDCETVLIGTFGC
jgi:hypothetical protein